MNTSCAMSLIQKRCPRQQFKCHRCGSRMLNGGLVWGITIPIHTRWYYDPGVTLHAHDVNLNASPTSASSGCNASGFLERQFVNPDRHATSPDGFPDWVQDFTFDWFPNLAFTFESDGQTWCSWLAFGQSFTVGITYVEAVMDGTTLVTPGYWDVNLSIQQYADYHQSRELPIQRFNAAVPVLNASYLAPEEFSCRSSDTFRFMKDLNEGAPGSVLLAPPYLDIRIYKP